MVGYSGVCESANGLLLMITCNLLCNFYFYAIWVKNAWTVKCKIVMITLYNFTEHHKANKLHIVSDFFYEIYQQSFFIILSIKF